MNYAKLSSVQSNFFRNSVIPPPIGRRSMRDEGMVTFNQNAMSFVAKIINYSESPAETKIIFEIPLEILQHITIR